MKSVRTLVSAHAVLGYFVLTFVISWSGILLVIGGPASIPGAAAQTSPLFPFVYLAMLAGPSTAGVLMTWWLRGRAGLRELSASVADWRVAPRWYAVALFTAPALIAIVLLLLSARSPDYLPGILTTDEKTGLVAFAVAIGLGAGFFEELGWTGFAVPQLRQRYGVLTTGLIVGTLWGLWHLLAVAWGIGGTAGNVPIAVFLPLDLLSFLPAYRVLMVYVYDRVQSVLLLMLMHASLTTGMLILESRALAGGPLLIYLLLLTTAMWTIVAGLGLLGGGMRAERALVR
jgi:membrane protease YdiL (CAAX protease family)